MTKPGRFPFPTYDELLSGSDRRRCFGKLGLSHNSEASRAVDRIPVSGNERNGCLLTTLSTGYFSLGTIRQPKFRLPCRPTMWTPGWDVDQLLLSKELLFARRPGERLATITARQRLVSKLHEWPLHETSTTSGTLPTPALSWNASHTPQIHKLYQQVPSHITTPKGPLQRIIGP